MCLVRHKVPVESSGISLYLKLLFFLSFQVDLLRGQKSDRVEVSLNPEELEVMDNVLPAKYVEFSLEHHNIFFRCEIFYLDVVLQV